MLKEKKYMSYNLETITKEMVEKDMADDGLVAWGQNSSKMVFWFGLIGAAFASYHVISKKGDRILITPFKSKKIMFEESKYVEKANILSAEIKGGLFGTKLVIKTKDKQKFNINITQGKEAVEQILKLLGF